MRRAALQQLPLQQQTLKLRGSRWNKCASSTSNRFKPSKLSCGQNALPVSLETVVRVWDRCRIVLCTCLPWRWDYSRAVALSGDFAMDMGNFAA